MPNRDYIISTLNLEADDIDCFNIVRKDTTFYSYITLKDLRPTCPLCGAASRIKGYSDFTFQTMPVNSFEHYIIWHRRRYLCKDPNCHYSFREENHFTPGPLHCSYSLLNQVARDIANLHFTYKDIAEKNNVSIGSVELYSDSFLNVPRLTLPENIGIDELHSDMAKYGSFYLCVMVDNTERDLFEVLPNRSKHELIKYFDKISIKEKNQVRFITMDLWDPYRDVAKRCLPNAKICADGFHVVEQLTQRFTRLRVDIMNQFEHGTSNYYLLKTWHWLLETDKYNLDNEPRYNGFYRTKMNYRDIYELLLKVSPELTEAYELKELYRGFNKDAIEENCSTLFDDIFDAFVSSDLPCYRSFIGLLQNWHQEILNSFQRPYDNRKESNALTENINGKLREYITVSNGLSNFDRFRIRVLYALNKHLTYTITDNLRSNKRKGRKRGKYHRSTIDRKIDGGNNCNPNE